MYLGLQALLDIIVPRAGSPWDLLVLRAVSPRYFYVPRAGSPGSKGPQIITSKQHEYNNANVVTISNNGNSSLTKLPTELHNQLISRLNIRGK